ncbi:MAG: manganese efflux pump [Eubacteriaceae bacterium]|nr:manganese efflux pump [Eubacteriaceae bacterium]MBR5995013.1 manganese efflux pump [Eubacteriaceae bacterium]
MNIYSLMLLGVSLAMDSFSVSVCKGLAVGRPSWKGGILCGAWFGGFQALMPLIGFFLGTGFREYITAIDHWVAFALLAFIGGNMIKESFSAEEDTSSASFSFKTMFLMAVATSIDALAVGIALAMETGTDIYLAVLIIGVVTFILSAVGFKVAARFGKKYEKKAVFAGGVILVFLGTKILFEHLEIMEKLFG